MGGGTLQCLKMLISYGFKMKDRVNIRLKSAVIASAAAFMFGGCTNNFAGEGALGGAAAGAAASAATGGNLSTGVAVGAVVGGAGGSFIRKNGRCYCVDNRGRERRARC